MEPLHALWLEAKYTPDDVVKILLTGHEEYFLRYSRRHMHGMKELYDSFITPAFEYIKAYRKADGKSYSEEEEIQLLGFVQGKYDELVKLIAKK
ncbi:unnamed protein product [Hyaloperonospora brassicae]|uniref:Uncharacterized protein n=1 Tax=Hyaloperonospora brassicae TaxID=162125 RepID=A0AAV0UUC8_HYABA|nr:unnamed protein product [Hyaloperonospora brassicae]